MTATPASSTSRKPASNSNTGNSLTAAKQLSTDIIAALGPSGVVSEYSSHGIRFAGDIRSNGVIECYGALRDTDNDSKPSAYVDTTTGKYKDSGGTETREIDLWEFIARKSGGDWLAVKKGLAERLGLAGGTVKGRRKSKAKPAPTAVQSSTPATPDSSTSRKPRTAEDPATALGFEDWTDGKLRLLSYWCLKYRRGISVDAVLAAGGRIAKYPLGRTNPATGEAIDVPTDYVVCVPVFGEPVVEGPAAPGLAGDGNVSATTATAMLAAGPTAYVIWKLNGKPFAIYRGKDAATGEPIYDEAKMKSIGSTDGVIGEHGLRVLANHNPTAAGPLTIVKPEGPTDLLAAFTAQSLAPNPDAAHTSTPLLAFAGTAKQANRWMAALFTGHTAVVVHDADRTGEAGVTKVCNLLSTTAADVRNVKLPYPIADKSGPDLRDYFNDGKRWGDFEEMVLWSESWVRTEDNGAEDSDLPQAPGDSPNDNETDTNAATEDRKPRVDDDDPHRLAEVFLAENRQQSSLRYWQEEWWIWNQRHYYKVKRTELKARVTTSVKREFDRLGFEKFDTVQKVTGNFVNNVIGALEGMCLVPSAIDQPAFLQTGESIEIQIADNEDSAETTFKKYRRNWIAMKNGILDVDALLSGSADVIRPHTPEWFSPVCLPYSFNPDATHDQLDAFLAKSQENDTPRINILQEWAGYCLLPDTQYQKFMILQGEGSNGKSVYCAILEALLGTANVSHIPLESFQDRFALKSTIGKLANIVAEVGEIDKVSEGLLKMFTSGDQMYFDRKGIDGIDVTPTARLLLATNNLPRFSDRTDGIWRRLILVPWHVQVKDDEKIHGMDKPRFWNESGELSGIFNWAITGLHRLRLQRKFTFSDAVKSAIDNYKTEVNPCREFLLDTFEYKRGESTYSEVIYGRYSEWCEKNGHRPFGNKQFGKEVMRTFSGVEREREGGGLRKYLYKHLAESVAEIT